MASTAVTAWGARLDEVLADGRWHDVEDVLALIAPLVPPGIAYREGERRRLERHGHRVPTHGPRQRGDQASAVATGARRIAKDAIRSRVRHGTVQRDGQRIRRRSS